MKYHVAGVLELKQILKRIEEEHLVEDYDLARCIGPASYELRIGGCREGQTGNLVKLQRGDTIAVLPDGFLLVETVERVNLQLDIMGMMYLSSAFARRGFVPWFQGIVDRGHSGKLGIFLLNLTKELVLIEGEERICHVVFERLLEPLV